MASPALLLPNRRTNDRKAPRKAQLTASLWVIDGQAVPPFKVIREGMVSYLRTDPDLHGGVFKGLPHLTHSRPILFRDFQQKFLRMSISAGHLPTLR